MQQLFKQSFIFIFSILFSASIQAETVEINKKDNTNYLKQGFIDLPSIRFHNPQIYFNLDGSSYAYIKEESSESWVIKNGKASPLRFKRIDKLQWSNNGKHFTYFAQRSDGTQVVVLDDKILDKESSLENYSSFITQDSELAISPDGKRVAYQKGVQGREAIFINGKLYHTYDRVLEGPRFSQTGILQYLVEDQKQYSLQTEKGEMKCLKEMNDTECLKTFRYFIKKNEDEPFSIIYRKSAAKEADRFVVENQTLFTTPYSIKERRLSPNGKNFVLKVCDETKKICQFVWNNQTTPWFLESNLNEEGDLSDDLFLFSVIEQGESKVFVNLDLQKQYLFTDSFVAKGKNYLYRASEEQGQRVVYNNVEGKLYDQVSMPQINSAGQFAYVAQDALVQKIILNEKEYGPYSQVLSYSLNPKSNQLIARVIKASKQSWLLIKAGQNEKEIDSQVLSMKGAQQSIQTQAGLLKVFSPEISRGVFITLEDRLVFAHDYPLITEDNPLKKLGQLSNGEEVFILGGVPADGGCAWPERLLVIQKNGKSFVSGDLGNCNLNPKTILKGTEIQIIFPAWKVPDYPPVESKRWIYENGKMSEK